MSDIFELMSLMKGHDLYFYLNGDDVPWNVAGKNPEIVFHCAGRRITVDSSDSRSVSYLASSLEHFLDPSKVIMSWGVKDFFSLLRGRAEMPVEFGAYFYDLSLICSYLGIKTERPVKFRDAVELLKRVVNSPGWKDFQPLYSSVYVPLVSRVIPEMETCCLVDNRKRICVYPYYVPEGQANGRLRAEVPSVGHYNPHSIGPEQKANLRPSDYDDQFVYFDFKNMEVNVLQWLSGDRALASALEEPDTYRAIWSLVTKSKATEAHRGLCKEVFLPVIFGQGSRSLASRIGVEEKIASKIIDTLVKTFPVAFDWVSSQSPDGDDMATDRFGRRRRFERHELYKTRNFSVQSPASMICLRKLVRLQESLSGLARLCFHVHDGYCVVCAANKIDSVFDIGLKTLEEEDDMFPGLKLKASCEVGPRLDNMKTLERGVLL